MLPLQLFGDHMGICPQLHPIMTHMQVMLFLPCQCLLHRLYLHLAVMYLSRITKITNPPCNTLFIGNLGENINEEELRSLFSVQPGYKQMKVLRQERHTDCFIEFEDMNSAINVHHSLQGAVIPSSGSVGMRIQYSKIPFGKRKDSTYQAPPPSVNGVPPAITYQ